MMKKIWIIIATLLGIPLLGGVVASVFYTQWSNNQNNNQKDISDVNISFSQTVIHIDNITANEANTIVANLTNAIVTKMNDFSVQLNIDYTIVGISDIKTGTNLTEIGVLVQSMDNNAKIKGDTPPVTFNWKENIDSWIFAPPIEITSEQKTGLNASAVNSILNKIQLRTLSLMNAASQANEINVDYIIENLNLIAEGAVFASYQNQLFIKSVTTSTKLIGQFQIQFT